MRVLKKTIFKTKREAVCSRWQHDRCSSPRREESAGHDCHKRDGTGYREFERSVHVHIECCREDVRKLRMRLIKHGDVHCCTRPLLQAIHHERVLARRGKFPLCSHHMRAVSAERDKHEIGTEGAAAGALR